MLGLGLGLGRRFVRHARTSVTARYMIASNRLAMPTDWGTTDTNFAAGGGMAGINGGNGTLFARYFYRRCKFTPAFTSTEGRFLWANVANGVNGVLNGLFTITVQRCEIRDAANAVVAVVTKDGGGMWDVTATPLWTDAIPTLAAETPYFLDLWWTAPDSSSWGAGPPAKLAGDRGAGSANNNLVTQDPSTWADGSVTSAAGGDFAPLTFVAKGWNGTTPVALILGDSIEDGTSVAAKLATARGDFGHIRQALGDATSGRWNYWPTSRYSSSFFSTYQDNINGHGGKNLADWIADATALLQPESVFNMVICEHGRNNLGTGTTFGAMQTHLTSAVNKMRSRYPEMPWVQTTTTPSTNATDAAIGYTTEANQTPTTTSNAAGGVIELWNNWVLAEAGGLIDLGIDTAAVCRGVDYGKWKAFAWTTTLLDAVAASNTYVINLADAPQVGDSLVFEPGTANVDYGGGSTLSATVFSVEPSGGEGYMVTLCGAARNSRSQSLTVTNNAGPSKAHAAGSVVAVYGTRDGLHPGQGLQMAMRDVMIAAKTNMVEILLSR